MEKSKKAKILEVLNVFETGSKNGNYGAISVFNDGPNDIKQITYGRSQTTEFGNLKRLISDYINAGGIYADKFKPYLNRIMKRPSLESDSKFISLLKKAASDPVMIHVQDEFFDRCYWRPAKKFFDQNNFKHPLSMLVIYDSYIHSGTILPWLRERFSATPDNEKEWISQYVDVRHEWLRTHRKPILRNTIYRTKAFKDLINDGNWDLSKEFKAHGVKWVAEPVHTVDPSALNRPESSFTGITLPEEKNIKYFYDFGDHLRWFSFPIVMHMPSGEILHSSVGDSRSDYVCHFLIKDRLEVALQEVYNFLGEAKFRSEGWNIFGGGYDDKGSYPEQLGLKFIFNPEKTEERPHFTDEAVDIMESHGFLNLGRATGKGFGVFCAYIPEYDNDSYYSKVGLPKINGI